MGRLVALLLWIAACCAPPAAAPVQAAAVDPFAERAAHFIALAQQHEPSVTPLLVSLARELGAEMYKLEFRLKTLASAERKIRTVAAEHHLEPAQIYLDDALRYTMVVADLPPGHYLDSCRAILSRLEHHGHRLVKAKNYWPDDDNYSGINSVLKTPDGLDWELQFHTPASITAQSKTRGMYEELRLRETTLDRKRALFDEMTRVWNAVPIPRGVLEPHALHQKSEILERERP